MKIHGYIYTIWKINIRLFVCTYAYIAYAWAELFCVFCIEMATSETCSMKVIISISLPHPQINLNLLILSYIKFSKLKESQKQYIFKGQL